MAILPVARASAKSRATRRRSAVVAAVRQQQPEGRASGGRRRHCHGLAGRARRPLSALHSPAQRIVPLTAPSRCGRSRRLRPAPRICGPPGLSSNCPWRVPWFDENAVLQAGGRDDRAVDDGAGCAAGEHQVRCHARVDTRIHAAGGLKAAVRIAPASANLQRTDLLRRVVCRRRPGPSNAGVFDGGSACERGGGATALRLEGPRRSRSRFSRGGAALGSACAITFTRRERRCTSHSRVQYVVSSATSVIEGPNIGRNRSKTPASRSWPRTARASSAEEYSTAK